MIGTCSKCGHEETWWAGLASIVGDPTPDAFSITCSNCGALVLKDSPVPITEGPVT